VGADNGAEAGFADIGVRKPYEHGRGQYALGFECAAAVLQGFVGIGVCSLAHDVGQHGFVGPRHDRADFALDRARDDVGGAHAACPDVYVRISMKAGDDGGMPDDVVVYVGMHVQCDAHGGMGVYFAQAAQQVAFGIFDTFGDHGAVQVEQYGVVAAASHFVQDQFREPFVSARVGGRAGPRFGGDGYDDFGALTAGDFDIAPQAAVGVFVRTEGSFAGEDFGAAAKEAFQRRGYGRERVGFVLDHCQ